MPRPTRFFDWLDDATDHPIFRALKTLLAALVLLSLCYGGYRVARDCRAQEQATNERLARALRGK